MVDRVYDIKNQIIGRIEQDISRRGVDGVDVQEMYMLVDMVKDLAEAEKSCWEAEYYRNVSDAMSRGGSSGYSGDRMDPTGAHADRSGWHNQYGSGRSMSRRGYSDPGSSDMVESVRMAMQGMSPSERDHIREQLRHVMDM